MNEPERKTPTDHVIWFCLTNRLVVVLLLLSVVAAGIMVAPFDWDLGTLSRNPVAVDAIPDIGENQQIVYTEWMGRSPQDVEDQITYPLTSALLGIPGVRTVRSFSMFGFSTIYLIFQEDREFYWTRSRILEKLNSLPSGSLPEGVQPTLGPDANALGQVFWYTLEGRDEEGKPAGGWDLHELRSIQDWQLRYSLLAVEGVAEVASIGGHLQEYQVDVDPQALRAHDVSLKEVYEAVRLSNLDVGARNLEINHVEYLIRGVGFIKELDDLRFAVVKSQEAVPIYIKDVAEVTLGPAMRSGVLDKGGAEVVGGVVVVRFGENPLAVIQRLKEKIAAVSPSLPQKTLQNGQVSRLTIVPFYDRTGLIQETLGTLHDALSQEMLVTIIVILVLLMNLRSALLVSGLLPLAVLMTFIAMKIFGVDSNLVSLSGIAIAIGTMVDMGIVLVENILNRLDEAPPEQPPIQTIYQASREVGGAVLTAVATTIVGFLPVFFMVAAEGKLFRPLAFTKTFALIASIVVALTLIPPFALWLLPKKNARRNVRGYARSFALIFSLTSSLWLAWWLSWWLAPLLLGWIAFRQWGHRLPATYHRRLPLLGNVLLALCVTVMLTQTWLPLGPQRGLLLNTFFVLLLLCSILLLFLAIKWLYPPMLNWAMANRPLFLLWPAGIVLAGLVIWLGVPRLLGWLGEPLMKTKPMVALSHAFPGLGREFMPPLDEGSFLFMPTTSSHAAINEARDILARQDLAIEAIPEVSSVVGKLGRVESALDPAPISMFETVIHYHDEFLSDASGHRLAFAFDPEQLDFQRDAQGNPVPAPDGAPYQVRGRFQRDDTGALVPDRQGLPFRQWRPPLDPTLNPGRQPWPGVASAEDIWNLIAQAGQVPGATAAPKLQPIAARLVMLQSGMRAPFGLKLKGANLASLESFGIELEKALKRAPAVKPESVIADRIVGKPYLEFHLDRRAMARYGIMLEEVQMLIETAIGGRALTHTVEGRERYPVRIRYMREWRDDFEKLQQVIIPTPSGAQIPLSQIAEGVFVTGPQMIKSEDTFLTSYVIFDSLPGIAEVEVVEQVQAYLDHLFATGQLARPQGVTLEFAGNYQNQLRAVDRLSKILPSALFLIFLLLYLQFHRVSTSLLVFSGILVAWGGGFILIWLYGQPWFFDFSLLGLSLRELFGIQPIHLSVAIWVGFLALFGIASDDGVLVATYLDQTMAESPPDSIAAIRSATLQAGQRRLRPALMTTATTVIALIPVLSSSGRGSDIMKPMAIPTFGGILIELVSILIVPVLYSGIEEFKWKKRQNRRPEPL